MSGLAVACADLTEQRGELARAAVLHAYTSWVFGEEMLNSTSSPSGPSSRTSFT